MELTYTVEFLIFDLSHHEEVTIFVVYHVNQKSRLTHKSLLVPKTVH
jgi:hypothetical protein